MPVLFLKVMKKMKMICRMIMEAPSGVRTSGFRSQVCCCEAGQDLNTSSISVLIRKLRQQHSLLQA